jgi:hypothetical protein
MRPIIFQKYIEVVISCGLDNGIAFTRQFNYFERNNLQYHVNHKYHLVKHMCSLLIILSLFCTSCNSLKMTRIDAIKPNQYILCNNHQNSILINDGSDAVVFRVRVKEHPANSSRFIVSEIRGRQTSKSKDSLDSFKIIQNDLPEGSTLSYAGTSWKILKIGIHGIQAWNQSQPSCLGGFVYIEQIR